MRIIRTKDYDEMSEKAANIFFAQLLLKPDSVLGLATGSTVLGIYGKLVDFYKKGDLDFSRVHTYNLDDYVGLAPDDDQCYEYFMNENFFKRTNIKLENTHHADGIAGDLQEECVRYNTLVESYGGADIQLLGLGNNGHVGFNEPGDCFIKETHVVDLDESTIKANARFFADEKQVPKQAITIGIRNIMKAKKIVLCVSGAQKAAILKEVITGPVTPQVPGSILQFHRDCIVIADKDALREL